VTDRLRPGAPSKDSSTHEKGLDSIRSQPSDLIGAMVSGYPVYVHAAAERGEMQRRAPMNVL